MKKQIASLFLLLACAAQFAFAGGVKVNSGSIKSLKGEKQLLVKYDYSNMKVGKGLTEEEYVNQKVKDANEKEAGKGEIWSKGWYGARELRYHPKFEELFNKESENLTISQKAENAKYTLVVKSVYTEPGFNVGVMKKPSYVNYIFQVVETANPSNVISEMQLNNVPGSQVMGYDFDAGSRIAESYAKAGKILGKFFVKNLK